MMKKANIKRHYIVRELGPDKVYFNYKRAPYLNSTWPVVIASVVEMAILVSELILFSSAYLQFLMIPLILFLIYRVLKHKEDIDKELESFIVTEQLGTISGTMDEDGELIAKEYFIIVPKEVYYGPYYSFYFSIIGCHSLGLLFKTIVQVPFQIVDGKRAQI